MTATSGVYTLTSVHKPFFKCKNKLTLALSHFFSVAHKVLNWTSAVKHSQDTDPKAGPQSVKLSRCSADIKRKSYQSKMRKNF